MIELAPVDAAYAAGDQAGARAERLRLLPSAGAPSLVEFFAPLRSEAALVLLPVAPVQSLAARISRLQPDAVMIAARNAFAEPWQNDSALRSALSEVPAILLLPVVDSAGRRLASELGIASVLPHGLSPRQLLAAIHAAVAGLAVTLPLPHEKAAEHAGSSEKIPRGSTLIEPLTPRERAVLDRMAHGCGNKQIAAQLDISEHTAKFHVSSILAKLGASSRTEAVTIGILSGLIAI